MMRLRHRMLIVLAGAASIALGASTIAHAQGAPPPIPPGNIPGVPKEAPKASPVIPDSVVGAPRETTPSKSEPRPKQPKPKPVARPKQPPAAPQPAPPPAVAVPVMPVAPPPATPPEKSALPSAVAIPIEPPAASNGREDAAYAAYQRGHYRTAFTIATERAEKHDDVKAMALLGELYAAGLGVKQDEITAAEWYRRAAERGDRDAMFALAMLRMAGRAGPVNRDEAAKLLAAAARLKHPMASYNLAMLYLEGQLFPRDFARAAELFREAAEAGSAEAQYALATLYKEGRGVKRDIVEFDAAALSRGDCRQPRRDGRVWNRAVQRLGRRQERGRGRPLHLPRARIAAARSRRTASPISWRPGAGCPPTRWRRSSGT